MDITSTASPDHDVFVAITPGLQCNVGITSLPQDTAQMIPASTNRILWKITPIETTDKKTMDTFQSTRELYKHLKHNNGEISLQIMECGIQTRATIARHCKTTFPQFEILNEKAQANYITNLLFHWNTLYNLIKSKSRLIDASNSTHGSLQLGSSVNITTNNTNNSSSSSGLSGKPAASSNISSTGVKTGTRSQKTRILAIFLHILLVFFTGFMSFTSFLYGIGQLYYLDYSNFFCDKKYTIDEIREINYKLQDRKGSSNTCLSTDAILHREDLRSDSLSSIYKSQFDNNSTLTNYTYCVLFCLVSFGLCCIALKHIFRSCFYLFSYCTKFDRSSLPTATYRQYRQNKNRRKRNNNKNNKNNKNSRKNKNKNKSKINCNANIVKCCADVKDAYTRLENFYYGFMSVDTTLWIFLKISSECLEILIQILALFQYGGTSFGHVAFNLNDSFYIAELPQFVELFAVTIMMNGILTSVLWLLYVLFPDKIYGKRFSITIFLVDSTFDAIYALYPLFIIVSELESNESLFSSGIGVLRITSFIKFLSSIGPLAFLVRSLYIALNDSFAIWEGKVTMIELYFTQNPLTQKHQSMNAYATSLSISNAYTYIDTSSSTIATTPVNGNINNVSQNRPVLSLGDTSEYNDQIQENGHDHLDRSKYMTVDNNSQSTLETDVELEKTCTPTDDLNAERKTGENGADTNIETAAKFSSDASETVPDIDSAKHPCVTSNTIQTASLQSISSRNIDILNSLDTNNVIFHSKQGTQRHKQTFISHRNQLNRTMSKAVVQHTLPTHKEYLNKHKQQNKKNLIKSIILAIIVILFVFLFSFIVCVSVLIDINKSVDFCTNYHNRFDLPSIVSWNDSDPDQDYLIEHSELLLYDKCRIQVYKLFSDYPCNCRYFRFSVDPNPNVTESFCDIYDKNPNYIIDPIYNKPMVFTNVLTRWNMLERILFDCDDESDADRINDNFCIGYDFIITNENVDLFFNHKGMQIMQLHCADIYVDMDSRSGDSGDSGDFGDSLSVTDLLQSMTSWENVVFWGMERALFWSFNTSIDGDIGVKQNATIATKFYDSLGKYLTQLVYLDLKHNEQLTIFDPFCKFNQSLIYFDSSFTPFTNITQCIAQFSQLKYFLINVGNVEYLNAGVLFNLPNIERITLIGDIIEYSTIANSFYINNTFIGYNNDTLEAVYLQLNPFCDVYNTNNSTLKNKHTELHSMIAKFSACTNGCSDVLSEFACVTSEIGNGVCSKKCNTLSCFWDKGDCNQLCDFTQCNVSNWVNDVCDSECNNTECNFDGRLDCGSLDCGEYSNNTLDRCESDMINNGWCDGNCLRSESEDCAISESLKDCHCSGTRSQCFNYYSAFVTATGEGSDGDELIQGDDLCDTTFEELIRSIFGDETTKCDNLTKYDLNQSGKLSFYEALVAALQVTTDWPDWQIEQINCSLCMQNSSLYFA